MAGATAVPFGCPRHLGSRSENEMKEIEMRAGKTARHLCSPNSVPVHASARLRHEPSVLTTLHLDFVFGRAECTSPIRIRPAHERAALCLAVIFTAAEVVD